METINQVAQAAAKAVWGESKDEPVSGKTGNTSAGEPYDAGNSGEPRTSTGVTGSDAVKPTDFGSDGDNYTTSGSDKPTGSTGLDAGDSDLTGTSRYTGTTDATKIAPLEDNYDPAGGSVDTSSKTENTGENKTGSEPSGADTTTVGENRTDDDVNTSGRDEPGSSSGPHKEFGSSVVAGKDMSKAQQDIRDPSDPQTDPKEAAAKSNVDDANDGFDKGDNPDKIDGPGPRPIEEVAKEFGGDAGNAKPEGTGKKTGDDKEEEEDGDGPQKTSHGEGTGDKYVKSSGLKADGGDFDATKPGAGREADRLLETKGVHREVGKPPASQDDDATDKAAGASHEKKGLGQKIKEKLHRHKD